MKLRPELFIHNIYFLFQYSLSLLYTMFGNSGNLKPYERFKFILKMFYWLLKVLCVNIADPIVRPKCYTLTAVASLYLCLAAWTIVTHDIDTALKCLCTIAIPIQGMVKNIDFLRHLRPALACIQFVKQLYTTNMNHSTKHYRILNECSATIFLVYKIMLVLNTCLYFGNIMMPFVIWSFTGKWTYASYAFLPSIDECTVLGRVLNMTQQAAFTVLAYFALTAADFKLLTLVSHCRPAIWIFDEAVDQLNASMRLMEGGKRKGSDMVVKNQLRNILLMHKDLYWFTKQLQQIYHVWFTAEIVTNGFMLTITVYGWLTNVS